MEDVWVNKWEKALLADMTDTIEALWLVFPRGSNDPKWKRKTDPRGALTNSNVSHTRQGGDFDLLGLEVEDGVL